MQQWVSADFQSLLECGVGYKADHVGGCIIVDSNPVFVSGNRNSVSGLLIQQLIISAGRNRDENIAVNIFICEHQIHRFSGIIENVLARFISGESVDGDVIGTIVIIINDILNFLSMYRNGCGQRGGCKSCGCNNAGCDACCVLLDVVDDVFSLL